jgi:hypothetical protein
MVHVDMEEGFKQMADIVESEKKMSLSGASSTTIPMPAVIRP